MLFDIKFSLLVQSLFGAGTKQVAQKMSLTQIKEPIAQDLKIFNAEFNETMRSKAPLMNLVINYVIKQKGKQIRPMLVFFSAHVCGQVNETTYRGAGLVELLHTATLIHDDIVDDSTMRRGMFSINALWKNKIAVLLGDYLLSKGLLLALDNNDFGFLKIVSTAVKLMSEGELMQLEKARKLDITEDIYYEIITNKTASLMAACCAIGAASVDNNQNTIEHMRLFGEKLGIAFQIKDDLLDNEDSGTGKPKAGDIKERKMTLPLIYALGNASTNEKKRIIGLIKNHNTNKVAVAEVLGFIERSEVSSAFDAIFDYGLRYQGQFWLFKGHLFKPYLSITTGDGNSADSR